MPPFTDPVDDHRHILLVGGQRCGTTWLRDLLASQSGIRSPLVVRPEPKFFLQDDAHQRYDALFPPDGGRWLLDKSTTYLEEPDAAARAAACVPDSVVVAVVRDPIERAFSNWRFSVANEMEYLPFGECLTEDAEARPWQGLSTSPFHYLRRGRYRELLEPWLHAFDSNVVVLQYERMVRCDGLSYLKTQLDRIGFVRQSEGPDVAGRTNASAVAATMTASERNILREYYAEPNREMVDLGIDLRLW